MNTFGKQALGRLMALMVVPTAAVRISAAQEYNFHGIGHLDNAGDYSEITAVSGDGEVVVGTSTSRTGYAAFVWTRDTGIQRLALPGGGGHESIALDVNQDGSVIVGQGTNELESSEGFVWDRETGPRWLGVPSGSFSEAKAVSPDGSVVIGISWGVGVDVVRWTNGNTEILGQPASFASVRPRAVSNNSVIVGLGFHENVQMQDFCWSEQNGSESLFDNRFGETTAYDVSADGGVIVGSIETQVGRRAVRWEQGVAELLDPDADAVAMAVSNDGQTIVGTLTDAGVPNAFVWDAYHGMRLVRDLPRAGDVNMGAHAMLYATGVTDGGRTIVGFGLNSNGRTEGWVMQMPERQTLLRMGPTAEMAAR